MQTVLGEVMEVAYYIDSCCLVKILFNGNAGDFSSQKICFSRSIRISSQLFIFKNIENTEWFFLLWFFLERGAGSYCQNLHAHNDSIASNKNGEQGMY